MSSSRESQHAFSRRQLLKGAALGLVAGGVGGFAHAPQAAAQDSGKGFEITGGTLVDVGGGALEVEVGGETRRFDITGETSVWKGGESLPPALKQGDDLMVKVRPSDDVALRVWSNLTRVEGALVDAKGPEYVLQTDALHTGGEEEVALELADGALFSDYTADGTASRRDLKKGVTVDAIGERLPGGGLRATLLYVHDPKDELGEPDPNGVMPADTTESTVSAQAYTYYGYATWFYCGSGAGRCGTCSPYYSNQAAWPALDYCGCCSAYCCDCSRYCKNQVRLACGSAVYVYSSCNGYAKTVYIADCGPCQQGNCNACTSLCGRYCADCYGYYTPVIDLTRPTFAALGYDPAYRGCFSCSVSV